ncbi:hypothetical protein BU15DRAFT_55711 [Melanogaster broomeanus]|nr:hypothetical protein BU15DRAFT_55711 [Melanogaster broomeanus]
MASRRGIRTISFAAYAAVSVFVQRLFSSSKHTLSDARSSMIAETASATMITKEWLKLGFGQGIHYLNGVSIH